jgi:hypothetical protein
MKRLDRRPCVHTPERVRQDMGRSVEAPAIGALPSFGDAPRYQNLVSEQESSGSKPGCGAFEPTTFSVVHSSRPRARWAVTTPAWSGSCSGNPARLHENLDWPRRWHTEASARTVASEDLNGRAC